MKRLKFVLAALAAGGLAWPNALWACAACYGQSDSPLAQGMNWGIFSLLAVVVFVLGSLASFFVYLGRKSAQLEADAAPGSSPEPARKE